jgi:hypothetical protein
MSKTKIEITLFRHLKVEKMVQIKQILEFYNEK